jgi:hypothetical protein
MLDAAGIPDPSRYAPVVTDRRSIQANMPTGNSSAASRALPPAAIGGAQLPLTRPGHPAYAPTSPPPPPPPPPIHPL